MLGSGLDGGPAGHGLLVLALVEEALDEEDLGDAGDHHDQDLEEREKIVWSATESCFLNQQSIVALHELITTNELKGFATSKLKIMKTGQVIKRQANYFDALAPHADSSDQTQPTIRNCSLLYNALFTTKRAKP